MKRFWNVMVVVLLVVCSSVLACMGTWLYLSRAYKEKYADNPVAIKAEEVNAYLERYYIDPYDSQAAMEAAADGASQAMIESTGDPWSYYIPASQMQAYTEMSSNTYSGIGITVAEADGGLEVMSVTWGSPADGAGLRVGDLLTHADGEALAPLGYDESVARIRGEIDTPLLLTVLRGEEQLELFLYRREYVATVAKAELIDGSIGYIIIDNFDEHCAEQTLACVDRMLEEGAQALLFDVRFNPGGHKEELLPILDALLPEGVIFRQKDYEGEEQIEYSDAACLQLPLAVLINEESYSAAEYFAAALQEYDAAEIVGCRTSGKGNFQYTFRFSDGSGAAISSGKYYTPQGNSLADVGVTPDVQIDLTDEDYMKRYDRALSLEEDAQFQAAAAILRQKIT